MIRAVEPDVVALQEVIGAGPVRRGHAEELGALLGMGWVMAPTRHLARRALRQRRPEPASDHASRAVRPLVEDVRAAQLPARGHRVRRRHAAPLQRPPRARRSSSGATRRDGSPPSFTTAASGSRRSSSATSTSGCAGSRRRMLSRTAAEHRPAFAPAAATHVSRHPAGAASRITFITTGASRW